MWHVKNLSVSSPFFAGGAAPRFDGLFATLGKNPHPKVMWKKRRKAGVSGGLHVVREPIADDGENTGDVAANRSEGRGTAAALEECRDEPSARKLPSSRQLGPLLRPVKVRQQVESVGDRPISLNSTLELLGAVQEDLDMFATHKVSLEGPTEIQNVNTDRLVDAHDDEEGYYKVIPGEILVKRYKVVGIVGGGVFSTVVKAHDLSCSTAVAVKIMRGNDAIEASGLREESILQKLTSCSQSESELRSIVTLKDSFYHKNHLCLVFELCSLNLRELLKSVGKSVGISLQAVRAYGLQALFALRLLQRAQVVHADVKPDNFVVSEDKTTLKLCDFGTAVDVGDVQPAPYLVSRFYRAPEVILCLNYSYSVDMWSLGCTLFELFTGHVLFPGKSNLDMLRLFVLFSGCKMPARMVRKSPVSSMYFNRDEGYLMIEEVDKITNSTILKVCNPSASECAPHSLETRIHRAIPSSWFKRDVHAGTSSATSTNGKFAYMFIDFLRKAISINPERRLTVEAAFAHPFLNLHVQ